MFIQSNKNADIIKFHIISVKGITFICLNSRFNHTMIPNIFFVKFYTLKIISNKRLLIRKQYGDVLILHFFPRPYDPKSNE